MKPFIILLLALAGTMLLLLAAIKIRKGCIDCTYHQSIHYIISGDTSKRPHGGEKLLPKW